MDKVKDFLMDFGILAILPIAVLVFANIDRKTAERNHRRTAKARRTRQASGKPKSRTKGRKSTGKRKKGPISKKEFLNRMRLGRLKAARARKKK